MALATITTTMTASVENGADSKKISFDEIPIKVGQKMQFAVTKLSKETEGNKNSFAVSLIGYVKDVTLIVSMPVSERYAGDPIIEEDQLHMRLFSGQSAYSFTTYVDKIIKLPFRYVHLAYPKIISTQNIRKSRRIRCHIPADLEKKEIDMMVVDISTSGAGIESKIPVGNLGTEIELSFTVTVFDESTPLTLKAIIKSAKPIIRNEKKAIFSGVEFVDLEKKQLTTLRHLIYQEIVERPEFVL